MLELQVVEARNEVLGEEHPDSQANIANLASICVDRNRLTEPEGAGDASDGKKKLGGYFLVMDTVSDLGCGHCQESRMLLVTQLIAIWFYLQMADETSVI